MNTSSADEAGLAMAQLGRFNDEMTGLIDEVFGTEWAEIEEILAIVVLAERSTVTTRDLAAASGLDRRSLSRLISRLKDEGLVTTRASSGDRRAIDVMLNAHGQLRASELRSSVRAFFARSAEIARAISEGLEPMLPPREFRLPADPLDLLRRTCQAGARLVRAMPVAATQGKLAARQRAALVYIAAHGSARPHELIPSLGVSRAGVTYIVDQLCAKGFVTRTRGNVPDDRRAVTLEATADGLIAVAAVAQAIVLQRTSLSELFAEIVEWSSVTYDGDAMPEAAERNG